jgi:hypothetical protein
MNSSDADRRPRVPAASGALLSAALGGLLCLTPSCQPDPSHAADTGPNVDANASDTHSTADTGPVDAHPADVVTVDAQVDAELDSVSTDVPGPDAAPADATANDASAVDVVITDATADDSVTLDATVDVAILDAGPADDVLDVTTVDATGLDAIPPCDVQADRMITYTDSASDVSFESFTALCTTRGGHVEIAPHCGGFNTCAGFSYDQTRETWTEHTCAGLNTCTGYSCVIP